MKSVLSLMKVLILESLRNPWDLILIFFLPVLLFLLVSNIVSSVPTVFFKANFELPSWMPISDKPDVILMLKDNVLHVKILTDDPVKKSYAKGYVTKLVHILEGVKPAFKTVTVDVGTYTEKAYLLTGFIGMILLASGMITAVRIVGYYREVNLLKLVSSLPLPKNVFLLFPVPGLVTSFVATLFVLVLGRFNGYELKVSFQFITAMVAGLLISFFLGILFVVFIKSSRGAMGFANLFYVIAPFISGMYFPVTFLPKPLQVVSSYLPSTWIVHILRKSLGM